MNTYIVKLNIHTGKNKQIKIKHCHNIAMLYYAVKSCIERCIYVQKYSVIFVRRCTFLNVKVINVSDYRHRNKYGWKKRNVIISYPVKFPIK